MSPKYRILLVLLVLCAVILAIGLTKLRPNEETSDDVERGDITPASTATPLPSETPSPTATDTPAVHATPSFALSPGQSKEGAPGSLITFTHVVTHTGLITDVLEVEAVSEQGWAVELLDSQQAKLAIPAPLEVGELDTSRFVVGVWAPDSVSDDCSDQIEVTVRSLADTSVTTGVTDAVTVRSTEVHTASLPATPFHWPPLAKLGVDFGYMVTVTGVVEYDLPLTEAMGANWVRIFLRWRDVEESRGDYEWEKYDPVFDRIEELGMKAIVAVHAAPDWAAEQSCGPISDTVALEAFLDHLVPRYTEPTDAWEFINEPDGREPHEYGAAIGCWGLHPDKYAQQLQIFHDKIRELDPGALVVFGGLAYDSWYHFERGFFEKALQNGAGPYFDAVSLHYYPINFKDFPTMAHKIREIQSIMTRNGVHDKRIWVTETGMWVNRRGDVEQQRDFIVQELTRGFSAGADNIFWFDPREHPVGEGVHRWLISADHEPINGYDTFQHFSNKLQGLYPVGPYRDVPDGIEVHAFSGANRSLYILWSNDAPRTVTIPSRMDAVITSRDGDESSVALVDSGMVTVEVGADPLFLEIPGLDIDANSPNLRDDRE